MGTAGRPPSDCLLVQSFTHTPNTDKEPALSTPSLSDLRLDGGTQIRVEINNDTVAEYAERILAGDQFPPILAYFDGTTYWLADGFHRYHAFRKAGREPEIDVLDGSLDHAKDVACAANHGHGLPRTAADKRKAAKVMLSRHPDCSDRAIADHCVISHHTVASVRSEIEQPAMPRTGLDGKKRGLPQNVATGQMPSSSQPVDSKGGESRKLSKTEKVIHKKAKKTLDFVPPEIEGYDPTEDQIKEAQHVIVEQQAQIDALKDRVAVGALPQDDQEDAAKIIAELRERIRLLEIENDAITKSRDAFQAENAQMKRQLDMQRRKIAKLEKSTPDDIRAGVANGSTHPVPASN